MKYNFPKIVEAFDLAEYHEDLGGQLVHVWLNPPAKMLVEMREQYAAHTDKTDIPIAIEQIKIKRASLKEETDEQKEEFDKYLKFYAERLEEINGEAYENAYEEYLGILSQLLSQGKEKSTHVSVEDLHEIEKATKEENPRFWVWYQNKIVESINQHRLGQKKG